MSILNKIIESAKQRVQKGSSASSSEEFPEENPFDSGLSPDEALAKYTALRERGEAVPPAVLNQIGAMYQSLGNQEKAVPYFLYAARGWIEEELWSAASQVVRKAARLNGEMTRPMLAVQLHAALGQGQTGEACMIIERLAKCLKPSDPEGIDEVVGVVDEHVSDPEVEVALAQMLLKLTRNEKAEARLKIGLERAEYLGKTQMARKIRSTLDLPTDEDDPFRSEAAEARGRVDAEAGPLEGPRAPDDAGASGSGPEKEEPEDEESEPMESASPAADPVAGGDDAASPSSTGSPGEAPGPSGDTSRDGEASFAASDDEGAAGPSPSPGTPEGVGEAPEPPASEPASSGEDEGEGEDDGAFILPSSEVTASADPSDEDDGEEIPPLPPVPEGSDDAPVPPAPTPEADDRREDTAPSPKPPAFPEGEPAATASSEPPLPSPSSSLEKEGPAGQGDDLPLPTPSFQEGEEDEEEEPGFWDPRDEDDDTSEPSGLPDPGELAGATPPAPDEAVDIAELLEVEEEDGAPGSGTRVVGTDSRAAAPDDDGQVEDLVRQLREGIQEAVPDEEASSHYEFGVAFLQMHMYREAVEYFQKAWRSEDCRVQAAEGLAESLLHLGSPGLALKSISASWQRISDDGGSTLGLLYWSARAHEALGSLDQARETYEEVCLFDLTFKDAKERLDGLEKGGGEVS